MSISAGRTGSQDNATFSWESDGASCEVRAEIYIDTGDKDRNEQAFDALEAERSAIESQIGEDLTWRDLIRSGSARRCCSHRVHGVRTAGSTAARARGASSL